ncbi:hypothetical protein PTSG_12801 [Salpingoeca rosetta]|uniref:DNA-3-methyladenine glycosylase I n=1 Tax=Salpingoeca rosetta (strain ATCC 50818 / BSB-021) TaxID=946362 RepID=F2UKU2_SALR5|nr:uncharacterized protein PTSG_12801 [Salpingoeca rosetta]EGD77741.1 hypothetical protein PTSG_12801 [Salpingoeca rosetta]|eukprot:XP_004990217.1 hypothetical protein PTSG_12801 [Salpingoeca rosetta]
MEDSQRHPRRSTRLRAAAEAAAATAAKKSTDVPARATSQRVQPKKSVRGRGKTSRQGKRRKDQTEEDGKRQGNTPSKTTSKRSKSMATHSSTIGDPLEEDDGKQRCWSSWSSLSRHYHDNVWGRPVTDDSRELFAWLCLEMMACGLTWRTVLTKEAGLRDAFLNFDIHHCASLSDAAISKLLEDERIIRNRAKVHAIRHNAKLVREMEQQRAGSFSDYVWRFKPAHDKERLLASGQLLSSHMRTDFKTKAADREESDGVHPTVTVAEFTKNLRKRGFKFVGETTVLSFMQAVGMVNHHAHTCFAFQEIEALHALGTP